MENMRQNAYDFIVIIVVFFLVLLPDLKDQEHKNSM